MPPQFQFFRFSNFCTLPIVFFWYMHKTTGAHKDLEWSLEMIVEVLMYVVQTRYIILPEKREVERGTTFELQEFSTVDLVLDIIDVVSSRELSDNLNCGEYTGITLKTMRRLNQVDEHAQFDNQVNKIAQSEIKSVGGKTQTEIGATVWKIEKKP